jgi:hypothetical protein
MKHEIKPVAVTLSNPEVVQDAAVTGPERSAEFIQGGL